MDLHTRLLSFFGMQRAKQLAELTEVDPAIFSRIKKEKFGRDATKLLAATLQRAEKITEEKENEISRLKTIVDSLVGKIQEIENKN